MPIEDSGYVVTPYAARLAALQADINARLTGAGFRALEWDDTIEGALTQARAALTVQDDERARALLDAIDLYRAAGGNLDRILAPRTVRRPASRSRYTFTATATAGTVTYPAGSLVRDDAADGRPLWRVVASTSVTAAGAPVVFEAVDAGDVQPSSTTVTLSVVTAVPGVATVTYDTSDGYAFTIGRLRESDGVYRARGLSIRGAVPAASGPGIRARLLELSWVEAAALAIESGQIAVTIAPDPAGSADRIAELAAALNEVVAYPRTFAGTSSTTVPLPGNSGETRTIRWTAGATLATTWAATATYASGVTAADVAAAMEEVARGLHASLDVGDPLRWSDAYCAIVEVDGVESVSALSLTAPTLGTASTPGSSLTPASTDLLTFGSLS